MGFSDKKVAGDLGQGCFSGMMVQKPAWSRLRSNCRQLFQRLPCRARREPALVKDSGLSGREFLYLLFSSRCCCCLKKEQA